jgi:hypothetical protein
MSYAIEIDDAVREKMALWNLPAPVIDELQRKFDAELGLDPARHLRDVVAPIRAMQYNCRLIQQGDRPVVHSFIFRVRYSQDESTLIIWDAFYHPLDPSDLNPPRPQDFPDDAPDIPLP